MEKRRITLDDGRYLIYYTFEDEDNLEVPPPSRENSSKVGYDEETRKPEQE